MSGYILCQLERASMPYYIENISMNIYSMEELCYYFYHNIYLLDDTIINEQLCDWLRKELGLEKLYKVLYKILEENRGTSEFILAVFKEINYLTHQEFKELHEKLMALESQPDILREKKKGDYLVENKMYVNAVRIYEKALQREEKAGMGEQFSGGIYHNMGCAYLKLFQFWEASECFLKAYKLLANKQILKHYLTVCYIMKPEEFPGICNKMGADTQLQQEIKEQLKEAGEETAAVLPEQAEGLLEQFISSYHRSTGF